MRSLDLGLILHVFTICHTFLDVSKYREKLKLHIVMGDLFNRRKKEQQQKRKQTETSLKRAEELQQMVSKQDVDSSNSLDNFKF